MKVLILGGSGMLGHKLAQRLGKDHQVMATVRRPVGELADAIGLPDDRIITGVETGKLKSVERAIEQSKAEVVINCIGRVKQLETGEDPLPAIAINSVFPHQLAFICSGASAKLIHVSTDCVFSGNGGCYAESNDPDATDIYGRSKLAGEVAMSPHLTLRTSIIGRELGTRHGLIEWFMAQPGPRVPGYSRAIFSGFPTIVLASIINRLINEHPNLAGLYHVSSDPIDKYSLLQMVADAYGRDVEVVPDDSVVINRSLDSSRFRSATGFRPSPWSEMVETMAADDRVKVAA